MKIIFLLLYLGFLFGCKSTQNKSSSSQLQEFKESDLSEATTIEHKLDFIEQSNRPEIKSIKYQVTTRTAVEGTFPGASKKTVIEVIFPEQLTVEQFQFLQDSYGRGKNHLSQAFNKPGLTLRHFLPPLMQATIGKMLIREETKKDGTQLSQNCWGTAYEAIRADEKSFTLFYVDYDPMLNFFKNPEWFQEVGQLSHHKDSPRGGVDLELYKNKLHELLLRSRPGDVLYITSKNFGSMPGQPEPKSSLQHAAVVVEPNLLFEKQDAHSILPFALVRPEDILKKYLYYYEDYYLIRPTGKSLPHISDPQAPLKAEAKGANKEIEVLDIPYYIDSNTGLIEIGKRHFKEYMNK